MASAPKKSLRYDYCIPCKPEAVHTLLIKQRSKLDDAAHSAALDPVWEIVLAEILNNISEHAYATAPDGEINISLTFNDDHLGAIIRDKGMAMPDGQLPRGNPPAVDGDLDSLPEGGFGWNLVHRLTRNLTYSRVDDENRLEMAILFDGHELS